MQDFINETVLSEFFAPLDGSYSNEEIIRGIEEYFRLKKGEITAKTRISEVVVPRQVAIWVLANKNMADPAIEKPQWSLLKRRFFPGFGHATMIHAFHRVNDRMEVEKIYREMVLGVLALFQKEKPDE